MARVRLLRQSFAARQEEGDASIPRGKAFELMHVLGFELDEHTFEELFEEVDSRGEGTVTRDEFITALGMLKQNILEVRTVCCCHCCCHSHCYAVTGDGSGRTSSRCAPRSDARGEPRPHTT